MSDGTLSREPKLKLVAGGGVRTLEDVIRELLQPILQEWLDDKLPEIIERLVRSEIARVLNDVAA
jgi:cell pole-organizing protein PopZ